MKAWPRLYHCIFLIFCVYIQVAFIFCSKAKKKENKLQETKRIDLSDDLRGRKVFGKIRNDGSVQVEKPVQPQHRRINWGPQIQVKVHCHMFGTFDHISCC